MEAPKSRIVYPIKVEHEKTDFLVLEKNSMVIAGTLALTIPLIYVQDVRYYNALPESYRYLYYPNGNGGSSTPSYLASDRLLDPAKLLKDDLGYTDDEIAQMGYAVFDRAENVFLINENHITPVDTQLKHLNANYMKKSTFFWLVYGNLSWAKAEKRPLLNIKYIAKDGDINGFSLPSFKGPVGSESVDYPVNISAVRQSGDSAEARNPVPVAANQKFDLGAGYQKVTLYNFDFDSLANQTLEESLKNIASASVTVDDPHDGSYPNGLTPPLNSTEYLGNHSASVHSVNNPLIGIGQLKSCVFTQLVDDLKLSSESVNKRQDLALSLLTGESRDTGLTATGRFSFSEAIPPAMIASDTGAKDLSLYYLSSDPAVAGVDAATGRVTGVAPGTAYVYAKARDQYNVGELQKPYARFLVTVKGIETLSIELPARVILQNGTLKAGQFTFELLDSKGKVLAEVTNDASGKIVFPPRSFSKEVANYSYTIRQRMGNFPNITQDKVVYTLSITTKLGANGKLTATVNLDKDGVPYGGETLFVNKLALPKTGDTALGTAGLILLAAVGLALPLIRWRAKSKKS